jgi:hypothetical protein
VEVAALEAFGVEERALQVVAAGCGAQEAVTNQVAVPYAVGRTVTARAAAQRTILRWVEGWRELLVRDNASSVRGLGI